jgi:hypothetical protein
LVLRSATIPELEPVTRVPPEVAHRLGYYVYLYVDPRSGLPFYVGKGQEQRVLAHLSVVGESRKAKVLAELSQLGMSPRLDILAHALPSEETALRIEAISASQTSSAQSGAKWSRWRSTLRPVPLRISGNRRPRSRSVKKTTLKPPVRRARLVRSRLR